MKFGIILGALLTFQTTAIQASDSSPDACARLKEKIERYQRLRRSGGSSKQMESWKRSLRKAEAKFRENRCRK